MPDENKTIEEQNKENSENEAAEIAAANAERLRKIDARAAEMGSPSGETYLTWLEGEILTEEGGAPATPNEENENMNQENENNKPVAPVEPKAPETPAAPAANNNDERLNVVSNAAAHAVLESQYTVFHSDQKDLPEADRAGYSKADLTKFISGPKAGLVQDVAQDPEFDGNIWKAAAHIMNITGGLAAAREAGAKSAEVLNNAKESASPTETKRLNQAGGGEGGEEETDYAKELEEMIAPTGGGYEEPK